MPEHGGIGGTDGTIPPSLSKIYYEVIDMSKTFDDYP